MTKTKKNVLEEKMPVAEEKTHSSQIFKSLVSNSSKPQSVCICQVHGSISAITQLPGGNALPYTDVVSQWFRMPVVGRGLDTFFWSSLSGEERYT